MVNFSNDIVYKDGSVAEIDFKSDVDLIAIADMNGDGNNDIVTLTGESSKISVYLNSGNGVYKTPSSTTINIPSGKALSSSQVGVTLGDFDGDGKTDLLVAGQTEDGSATLNLWYYTYQTSSRLFTLAQTSTVSLSVYASGSSYTAQNYEMVQVGADVAVRISHLTVDDATYDRAVCFVGDGTGSFTDPGQMIYKKTNPQTPLSGESLVGSVILTNGSVSRTFLVTQTDLFNFYDMSASPVAFSSVSYATETISHPLGTTVSGNTLFYCNTTSMGELLLQMDASGKVSATERDAFDLTFLPTTGVSSVVLGAGDLNSDSYTDLMVTVGTEYVALKGISSETNMPRFAPQPPVVNQGESLATWNGDFDGDGALDLVVVDSSSAWLYRGADQTTTPVKIGSFNGEATAAVLGYFGSSASSTENDSLLDLALLYNGKVGIFFQQDGRFTGETASEGSCVVTFSSGVSGEAFLASGDVLGTGNEQLVVCYKKSQTSVNTLAVIDPLNWGSGPVETFAIPNNYKISSLAVGALCGEIVGGQPVIDSYADIVYSVQSQENSSLSDLKSKVVILNNTTGTLSSSSVIEKTVVPAGRIRLDKYNPHQPTSLTLADITSDGLLDIVFLSEGSGSHSDAQLGYFCQTGDGVGVFSNVVYVPAVNKIDEGDGQAGTIRPSEDEGFGDEVVKGGITVRGEVGGLVMEDISGDGHDDAVFTVTKNGYTTYFTSLGTGNGTTPFKAPVCVDLAGDVGPYKKEAETASAVVSTLSDIVNSYDGVISLREAISYAGTGGVGTTITFNSTLVDRTITLSDATGYKTLVVNKSLTIDASALSGGITISGDDKNRIFLISGLEDENPIGVTFKGLTLSNGYDSTELGGGAVYIKNASVTLQGAISFQSNHSSVGGGAIFITSTGSLTTDANTTSVAFTGNYCGSGQNGGAINNSGTLSLTDALFTGNSAKEGKTSGFDWTTVSKGSGGAIINWKTATLTDCTFTTNYAGNGGAIANGMTTGETGKDPTYATLTIKQTEDYKGTMFSSNEACYGGAIINAGKMQIGEENQAYAIIISSNTAHKNGGAISNTSNGATAANGLDLTKMYATLYNTTLSSNTALNGGAIVNQTALTTAQNSVFTGNSATNTEKGSGGAIDVLKDATLATTDTTFTSNTATNGFGGALQVWGTATLGDGTTIGADTKANSAKSGGGLSVTETGKATLSSENAEKKVTIANNTATYGGGIYAYGDLVLGQNTSIASNQASKNGGGISLTYVKSGEGTTCCGSLTVTGSNNIVSGNTAGTEATSGTTYYGGGIIANRGTYIDIANTTGGLTLLNNVASKGKDVALDCVALVNSAYKTLNDENLDRYISRCAEIYYKTTLTGSQVSGFKLTSFTYQPSDDPSVIAWYTVSGQSGTDNPTDYEKGITLTPAVDDLTFDIYASKATGAASIIYHLPTSGSVDPDSITSNAILEDALSAYLEEESLTSY